jgi:hypothetical protein
MGWLDFDRMDQRVLAAACNAMVARKHPIHTGCAVWIFAYLRLAGWRNCYRASRIEGATNFGSPLWSNGDPVYRVSAMAQFSSVYYRALSLILTPQNLSGILDHFL